MVIKINYTSSDVYVSTSVSPVYVVVNYSGTTTGAAVWGQITGTLSDQTDLQNALDAKFDDPTGTTAQYLRGDGSLATFPTIPSGTVTSVGLTMPSAFSVANSPITSSGTIAVTGAGTASQYIRGDGQLATLPSNSSGGSSVAYYLNGSVAASVGTYYQMSKTAVIGTGTDFSKAGNGLISQFLTDVADPNRLEIPAGAWNFEMYFSASSSGGTPAFYVELLKYDGTTFTSIASSSAVPEAITSGTIIDLYLTSLAIPQTTLLSTDRLAIRVYIVNSTGGRTITMHTENSHLCEIITNFAGGVSAFNGLTANTQYFATGTSGTDFAISSATDTHTFNLPTASATNRGALSSADWSTFSGKVGGSGTSGQVAYWNGTNSQTGDNNLVWNSASIRLGIGRTPSARRLEIQVGSGGIASALGMFDGGGSLNSIIGIDTPTTTDLQIATVQGIRFYTGSTLGNIVTMPTNERMRLFSTGNLLLQNGGTFTDGGQRLQVQGDAFIKGSGATSATTALTVQNSGGSNAFRVRNDGTILFGNDSNNVWMFPYTTYDTLDVNGRNLAIYPLQGSISIGGGSQIQTSGTQNNLITKGRFQPSSGTATFTEIRSESFINQTGGANGITRGLYVNPTLTAAADWRSIEWSNNSGWGLYGAGTAANYLGGRLAIGNVLANSIYALNVEGILNVSRATGNPALSFNNSAAASSSIAYLEATASELHIYAHTGRNISFTSGAAASRTMTLTAAGRLLLGTTTESTFALDVNGTARVSDNFTVSRNQNTVTELLISNTTSGTGAYPSVRLLSDASSGSCVIGKNSTTFTTYKINSPKDLVIYNNPTGGDIAILNDFASGSIKFAAGGSSTAHMTLASNGNLLVGTTTDAGERLQINGTSRFSSTLQITGNGTKINWFNSGFENWFAGTILNSTSFSISSATTSNILTLFTTGAATFSSSVTAGGGTNNASAILQADSTTRGFLPPRMTNAQRSAISSPAVGLIVYCTDLVEGLYVYKSTGWTFVI